ncbi:MAG TPA: aminopeptidase [Thermoplasmata archaeon]|nr:aminopeptidase [Thermoplasmata archaeon]
MEDGARLILRTSAGLREKEKVLVLVDRDTKAVGDAFLSAARGLGADPVVLVIAPRERDGEEPPEIATTAMESADLIVLATRKSLTHTHARRQANRAGARVISIPGVTEDMLAAGGLAADWGEIHEVVRRVARRLRAAEAVHLTNSAGTDLTFSVDGREWISEDTGLCSRRGAFTTLPAGELFVAPVETSAEGRLVADVYFDEPLIESVTATLREGHATKIVGASKAVHAMNSGGREARTLGRFGFGLNAHARTSGPHMEAEKALGCASLGFGDNTSIGGRLACGVHVECILSEVSIEVDGKSLIDKGHLAG